MKEKIAFSDTNRHVNQGKTYHVVVSCPVLKEQPSDAAPEGFKWGHSLFPKDGWVLVPDGPAKPDNTVLEMY